MIPICDAAWGRDSEEWLNIAGRVACCGELGWPSVEFIGFETTGPSIPCELLVMAPGTCTTYISMTVITSTTFFDVVIDTHIHRFHESNQQTTNRSL